MAGALAVVHPLQRLPARTAVAAAPAAQRQTRVDFERLALNLLLLPLVDDATPPRWQAFGVDWVCAGGGDVRIDGLPIVDGAPLPATSFRLEWTLHRCPPLADADLLVDGTVTLTVFHDDDGVSAVVEPRLRTLERGRVERRMDQRFVAAQALRFTETR